MFLQGYYSEFPTTKCNTNLKPAGALGQGFLNFSTPWLLKRHQLLIGDLLRKPTDNVTNYVKKLLTFQLLTRKFFLTFICYTIHLFRIRMLLIN